MFVWLLESLYWACGLLPLAAAVALWFVIRKLTHERPDSLGKQVWRAGYRVGGIGLLLCGATLAWCVVTAPLARLCGSSVAEDGAPLVRALEAYRTDHGGYPSSLDQLIPRFMATVPTTSLPPWGFLDPCEFTYHALSLESESRYELFVRGFHYRTDTGEWVFDDRAWFLRE